MNEFDDLTRRVREFRDARDWAQFHSVKNLASSVCIEAAELLEALQWVEGDDAEREALGRRSEIAEELADVSIYLLLIADKLGIDLAEAIDHKLRKNAAKYPVERARGSSRKYTEL
jgi:NTP pyrophosphatase (non-canonical NTP hydrolase)